jgi:hypothetical protein
MVTLRGGKHSAQHGDRESTELYAESPDLFFRVLLIDRRNKEDVRWTRIR